MVGWVAGFYKHITNSAQTEVGAGAELGNNNNNNNNDKLVYCK